MSRRPRVVMTTETFHPEVGGGETQARTLVDALVGRGYAVTLITRRSRRELPRSDGTNHLEVIRVPPAGRGRWKKWGLSLTVLPALLRTARQADAIVVSGFRILGTPALIAAGLRRVPCILKGDSRGELSGDFFRAGLAQLRLSPQSLPVRWFLRCRNALLRRARRFVALSADMAAEFIAHGVPPDRVAIIPNGVDVNRFRPASAEERQRLKAELGWPEGPVAVYTGRLVTYKGLPLLLRVWEALRREGSTATLVLVGEGGADMHNCENELRAFVREQGLETSVRFTGPVDDVSACLRAADLFVFPTMDEAFGLSLVEAMACGLPVVSTAVGGIRDFLAHGTNGMEVPAGDADALHRAISRLLADDLARQRLGCAARDTAVSRYSLQAVATAWVDLFETVSPRQHALQAHDG